jgi:hypothetical protein
MTLRDRMLSKKVPWLTSVIPATWGAKTGKIKVQDQLRQKVSKTIPEK